MGKLIGVLFLLALLPVSLRAQEGLFSSLYSDLGLLDQTIESLDSSLRTQQAQLQDLQRKISGSMTELMLSEQEISGLKAISETQGIYLTQLQQQIAVLERIRHGQLKYQNGLERQLLGWKIGGVTLAISAAGLLAWALIDRAR